MKTKDIVYIIGGLIIGIAVGVLIATLLGGSRVTEDQVRAIVNEAVAGQTTSQPVNQDDLVRAVINTLRTGPAVAQTRDINSAFFLVPVEEAGSWLETIKDVEFDEEVTTENIELLSNEITSESQLALYFTLPERVTTVNSVLSLVYDAMLKTVGVAPEEAIVAGADPSYVVCLGLDNDPYSLTGPLLYFYMQVPTDKVETLQDVNGEFPTGWEKLDGPRENSMLWTAECYDPTADEAATE
ncbi:MAG: hypothetical protein MUE54_10110 [Anaerolineae bacterium]|jgi:hypothetical protein|nr:hypothetical protein [Anaerolineae bacterium]